MIQSSYSIEGDSFIRRDTQNVDDIIKKNLEERNTGDNDSSKKEMRKIASIPLAMVEYLKTRSWKEGGPIDINLIGNDHEHAARFTLWLNDSTMRAFRTSTARV